jgi:hypothetical protein
MIAARGTEFAVGSQGSLLNVFQSHSGCRLRHGYASFQRLLFNLNIITRAVDSLRGCTRVRIAARCYESALYGQGLAGEIDDYLLPIDDRREDASWSGFTIANRHSPPWSSEAQSQWASVLR